jgi:hypothetical protein
MAWVSGGTAYHSVGIASGCFVAESFDRHTATMLVVSIPK